MNELIESNQLIRSISIILTIWVIYFLRNCFNFFWVAQILLSHLTNQTSTNFTSKKTHGQNGYVQHDFTKMIIWLGWILSLLCGFLLVFLFK
jgi:hypothetical protein